MVALQWLARIGAALLACAAVVLLPSTAWAADCVGPDDPPGCVTPSPTPSDPPASPTPEPSPSVTPSASATAPAVVVLDSSQFDVVLWVGGALLAVSLVGVVGSWSR